MKGNAMLVHKRRNRLLVAVAFGSLLLPRGHATGKGFDDPCALLSLAEIRTFLPDAKAGVRAVSSGVSTRCTWESATPGSSPLFTKAFSISLVKVPASSVAAAKAAVLGAATVKADVGDGGGFVSQTQIIFFKGAIQASLGTNLLAVPQDALLALAKKVAAAI
jgi:hypothetical protein